MATTNQQLSKPGLRNTPGRIKSRRTHVPSIEEETTDVDQLNGEFTTLIQSRRGSKRDIYTDSEDNTDLERPSKIPRLVIRLNQNNQECETEQDPHLYDNVESPQLTDDSIERETVQDSHSNNQAESLHLIDDHGTEQDSQLEEPNDQAESPQLIDHDTKKTKSKKIRDLKKKIGAAFSPVSNRLRSKAEQQTFGKVLTD